MAAAAVLQGCSSEPVPPAAASWSTQKIWLRGGQFGPVGPVGPASPAIPWGPVGPVLPVAPVGPVLPVGPVGPVLPPPPPGPNGLQQSQPLKVPAGCRQPARGTNIR